jgi:hypothetical protein
VERPAVGAAVDAHRRRAFVERGRAAHFGGAFERVVVGLLGHAPHQHVDEPARGAIAVEQRGRAAQHLDAIREQWIDGDGVVRGQRGDVERFGAVLADLHAFAGQAADDGAARLRTEVRGADARGRGQRLADARAPHADEVVARQDRGGLRDFERRTAQRGRRDDDFVQIVAFVVVGFGRRRDHGNEKDGNENRKAGKHGIDS